MRAVKEVQTAPRGGEAPEGPVQKLQSFPVRTLQFLHDVRLEMRNVTWPTWKDVQATTVVVVVTTFFFGFFLGLALDIPFSRWMEWLFQHGKEWVK